ncbi:MAG: hypothetical protein KJ714_06320, partial [Euryarchaeota archaeon]|nr:hypothetical protein [Euryarchaeota archaeon]
QNCVSICCMLSQPHLVLIPAAFLHYNPKPPSSIALSAPPTIQKWRPKNAANAEFSIMAMELR